MDGVFHRSFTKYAEIFFKGPFLKMILREKKTLKTQLKLKFLNTFCEI
jgi:hypothetical protein